MIVGRLPGRCTLKNTGRLEKKGGKALCRRGMRHGMSRRRQIRARRAAPPAARLDDRRRCSLPPPTCAGAEPRQNPPPVPAAALAHGAGTGRADDIQGEVRAGTKRVRPPARVCVLVCADREVT